DGGSDADLILATASRSVAVTSALAALLNPIWLSLICTKRSPPASMPCRIIALRAACSSDIPFRTPLVIVHTAPVPTHAMHFRNPRRSHSRSSCFFVIASASLRLAYTDQGGARDIPKAGRSRSGNKEDVNGFSGEDDASPEV